MKQLPQALQGLLVLACVLTQVGLRAMAQDLNILEFGIDQQGQFRVSYPTAPSFYYVLYRGSDPAKIQTPADMALGTGAIGTLTEPGPLGGSAASYYRVARIAVAAPLDADGDGIDDVYELRHSAFLSPLNPADARRDFDQDGATNLQEYQGGTNPAVASQRLTRITSSPAHGEGGVSVTRETIVYFSNPLTNTAVFSNDQFNAVFGGRRLLSRIELSSDRRKATLFYLEPLPGSARVQVTFKGDGILDQKGLAVDADGDGQAGGVATISFDTETLSTLPNTIVCGRVFASALAARTNGVTNLSINVPLPGVIVTADGLEEKVRATTDAFGNFRLTNAPAGDFFAHIDGRPITDPAQGIHYPDRAYYPYVGKRWRSLPGEEVNIGEIYLPLITSGTLQPVSVTAETSVTFPAQVLKEHPDLAGVTITVPANALFSDDGKRGGMVGIAPVPPDRLPGPLPDGLEFPLVITVQTDGPSNFDQPVSACFPNLPDPVTGLLLAPGETSALWSFDHDTGRWEIRGSMTVSADGKLICTDPGIGLLSPGWHGTRPGSVMTGGPIGTGRGSGPNGRDSQQEPPNPQPGNATDPVYLFSGEVHEAIEDLHIPGRGLDFSWIRTYRSKIGLNTAQGNGWDFSYNLLIEAQDGDLLVHGGNSRIDRYRQQAGGTYTSEGFFRELSKNADGTFVLTFEDTGKWQFRGLDGGPAAGKISRIEDRNGNALTFFYDGAGRLERIRDTLDRDIRVTYEARNLISGITDFAGRTVQYAYYNGVEAGGAAGDLKSATTPVVTGTPNRNDFPKGKTRTYTYSTGFADDRLNHNLLTMTDGRRNDPNDPTFGSGPYLANVYAGTTNPEDPDFDRVVRQVWGGAILDIVYVPVTASSGNGGAVIKAILNDRNGNVKEYFYDEKNRMVRLREYTGQADPRQPTTELSNRPKNKLRPSDPDYFETVFEWTDDSLQRRIIYPNGNLIESVYESDLNSGAPARIRGNLRLLRKLPGTHQPVGDQTVIEESYEYDSRFGGAQFVTKQVDGRGNATLHAYDARGNRIRTQRAIPTIIEQAQYNSFGQPTAYIGPDNGSNYRRTDTLQYFESGPQRGYLKSRVVDSGALALATTYEYDLVGNVVRVTDPRGQDTQYAVNALNQVVRETSREVAPGTGLRYQTDYFYDGNNNLSRVDIQNIDDQGALRANTHYSIVYDYELLNYPISVTEEIEANRVSKEEYQYDGNRNRILTRHGEAVNGRQPSNNRRTRYDERDLEFQVIRGVGSPEQSTAQYDYDANGNLVAMQEGLEQGPRVVQTTYDGFDRPVAVLDPLGNRLQITYDANDNRVHSRLDGELVDGPGAAGNVRLSETTYVYDGLDRLIRTETPFFDAVTQSPKGNGSAPGQIFYNGSSQIVRLIDANGHEHQTVFDTANRVSKVLDAKGNSLAYAYDGNGNVVATTELDKSDLDGSTETFVTRYFYDGLDRLTRMIDPAGSVRDYAYDSRDNQTRAVDALRAGTDQPGNVTRYEYDGLNRLVRTTLAQTTDGSGGSALAGSVVLNQTWDDSNRLSSQTDPNGNVTSRAYDPLNREILQTYADGTRRTVRYDVHDNLIEALDASGTKSLVQHDLLNRPVRVDVQPGAGVRPDTTFEIYKYDGLSRLVYAENNGSVVRREHDSLSHVIRETQNGKVIASTYDAVGNRTGCTYPGGRTVLTTYDELDRKRTISDQNGLVASYKFAGPLRVKQRDYANGTRTSYEYDGIQGVPNPLNDFGVQQIIRTSHTKSGASTAFENRAYTWDKMGSKTSRRDLRAGGAARQLQYDSLYRLTHSTTVAPGKAPIDISYELDAAGNRRTVQGGAGAGSYSLSSTRPGAGNKPLNEYAVTPFDQREYDPKGNLVSLNRGAPNQRDLAYDYRNQLVEHFDPGSGVRTQYAYDALGRRIQKVVNDPTSKITRFYYAGSQVCEEQDGNSATQATYVYGQYVDEVLHMRRGNLGVFYHGDDTHSVTSLTDGEGNLLEQYDYDDFGQIAMSDPAGLPRVQSAVANPYFFNGARLDAESGWYFLRTRYFEPRSGRFTSRDAIGLWGDPSNLGVGTAYAANNPWSLVDPYGLSLGEWLQFGKDEVIGIAATTKGSLSILTSTFSFGLSDKVFTNSEQYRNQAVFREAQVFATISREATLTVVSMGANAARGGVCMLEGMGRVAPLIRVLQQSERAAVLANWIYKTQEAINLGKSAYDFVLEVRKIARGNGSYFRAALSGLGVFSGVTGLRSPAGTCFAEGTPVLTADGLVPIEHLAVGDRVLSIGLTERTRGSNVDPPAWRVIDIRVPDPTGSGDVFEVSLLRPAAWVEAHGCSAGTQLRLALPEMGLDTTGWVIQVRSCPPLGEGPGEVVLATVRSLSGTVLRLGLAGLDKPVAATRNHPFFSCTRQDWVRAGDLATGEWVKTRTGSAQVIASIPAEGLFPVYNLEVESEHTYFVTELGILSHNSTARTCPDVLYRGVPGGNTDKARLGKQGIVKPRGEAVDAASLRKHVLAEDVASGVTSWTPDREIAKRFAGPNGTIIEIPGKTVVDRIVPRPNVGKYAHEREYLIQGVVTGKPTRP